MGLVHLSRDALVLVEGINLLALRDPETAFSATDLFGLSRALIEAFRKSAS